MKIREELHAEMKSHLERQEAAQRARQEAERYDTQVASASKLALVRGATNQRVDTASVQAHTEVLQQTRELKRREAEYVPARLHARLSDCMHASYARLSDCTRWRL